MAMSYTVTSNVSGVPTVMVYGSMSVNVTVPASVTSGDYHNITLTVNTDCGTSLPEYFGMYLIIMQSCE